MRRPVLAHGQPRAPPITARGLDQPRGARVKLDVPRRGQDVRLIEHERREPSLPQMASPPLAKVDHSRVTPMDLADRQSQPVGRLIGDNVPFFPERLVNDAISSPVASADGSLIDRVASSDLCDEYQLPPSILSMPSTAKAAVTRRVPSAGMAQHACRSHSPRRSLMAASSAFQKRERSLAVDRVRPHEKLDRTAVADAELGVVQEVDLGKLVGDGFVR